MGAEAEAEGGQVRKGRLQISWAALGLRTAPPARGGLLPADGGTPSSPWNASP